MNQLIDDFNAKESVYNNCKSSALSLIESLLHIEKVHFHSVSGRVKAKDKITEKIQRKNGKYNKIEDITDVVGIRIITYFEDEIDTIAKIIEKEFKVDWENSVDKRAIELDRFGYKSLHFVVEFDSRRKRLLEYKPYKGIKIEIQIRSILQHGWAEIEHDLGYKGEFEIPDVAKRTFYRLSALLETADIEFVRLKTIISDYENVVKNNISDYSNELRIDKASLLEFIKTSKILAKQNEEIITHYNFIEEVKYDTDTVDGELIRRVKRVGIDTIGELNRLLVEHEKGSLEYFINYYDGHKITALNKAAAIYNLCNYLKSL